MDLTAPASASLTTVGPEGTDGSPRGDDGPVVPSLDDTTLSLPDWKGQQPHRLPPQHRPRRPGQPDVPGARHRTAIRINGTAV